MKKENSMTAKNAADKNNLVALAELHEGEHATVRELHGGMEFKRKIIAMGLMPGMEIEIRKARPKSHGPMVVAFLDSRLALGHGMAEKIMVEKK